MRWILRGAAVAGLALGGSTGTFAQGMGTMGMTGMKAYDAKPHALRPAKPAPRATRSYYRGDTRTSACGVYHYWSKGRCKDARINPPDLK